MLTRAVRFTRKDMLWKSVDDVEDILEHNKKLRGVKQESDWGRHVASVPNILLLKWINEELDRGREIRWWSPEFRELVRKKLQDPDYAYLRTD